MSSLMDLVIIWITIVGIIGTYWILMRRYKIELRNEGHAVSLFGKIGKLYLEENSSYFQYFTVMFPVCILGAYGGISLNDTVDREITRIIMPYLAVLVFAVFVSIIIYSTLTIRGRSSRKAVKILRNYWWKPHKKDEFKIKLAELAVGDRVDRATVQCISRRGCTASFVAKEVLSATSTTE